MDETQTSKMSERKTLWRKPWFFPWGGGSDQPWKWGLFLSVCPLSVHHRRPLSHVAVILSRPFICLSNGNPPLFSPHAALISTIPRLIFSESNPPPPHHYLRCPPYNFLKLLVHKFHLTTVTHFKSSRTLFPASVLGFLNVGRLSVFAAATLTPPPPSPIFSLLDSDVKPSPTPTALLVFGGGGSSLWEGKDVSPSSPPPSVSKRSRQRNNKTLLKLSRQKIACGKY